jgi:Ni/Co efflux regulator RcnB
MNKKKVISALLALTLLAGTMAGSALPGARAAAAEPTARTTQLRAARKAAKKTPKKTTPKKTAPKKTTPKKTPVNPDTAWLPSGVKQLAGEKTANPALAKAIIDYYQIPESEWSKTKYSYNYVDFNKDGKQEIFAVVTGAYVSGTGGDSALWVIPYADMAVSQSFTLVRTPVIVTDRLYNGAQGLIVRRSGGGGKTETVLLTCRDGEYDNVSGGKVLTSLKGVTGTAIVCSNPLTDAQSGSCLTLGR